MSQQELLKKVIQALDAAQIPYMITGSVASSLQGEPRASHDVDLVVTIEKSKIAALKQSFPSPNYYLDEGSIQEAVKKKDMFNLIDAESGDKVDFWILKAEPFDQSRFFRRYLENFQGVGMYISRPEDTILVKLKWAKLSGGSEKQFTDALRIYEVQAGNLDLDYLKRWADKLNVNDLWQRIRAEAETL